MKTQNGVSIVLVVLSAVIPYLISQKDVPLPAILIVILTATNIGLMAFARLSNPNSEPVQVALVPPEDPKP